MGEDGELKFVCKLCNKKYRCGKSLGGHMKSHIVATTAEFEEDTAGHGQSGYGLRENPKKTQRAFDSTLSLGQDYICKQCGKGFMSSKALCGHMASHSEKLKDDYSWIDENSKIASDSNSDTEETEECKLRIRSSKSKKFLKKASVDSPLNSCSSISEIDEQEEVAKCLMMLSRNYENKGGVNSVVESSDNHSTVMEAKSSSIDMLIATNEGFVTINKQTGDPQIKLKNIILDDEITQSDDSGSDYFLGECTKSGSDVSVDGFRMNYTLSKYNNIFVSTRERGQMYEHDAGVGKNLNSSTSHRNESRKRKSDSQKNTSPPNADACNDQQKISKYECFNCKKTFKSFQALGGHRPCHKRTNAYYQSRYESDEDSLEDDTSDHVTDSIKQVESGSKRKPGTSSQKKVNAKKNIKLHVCPFCSRVFKNGQALGGHKRKHYGVGREENNASQGPVLKSERPDPFDLNLPAPEADSFFGN